MSTLTGPAILAAMARGQIKIEPFDPKLVNPHSVDLHLGPTLKVYDTRGRFIDSKYPPGLREHPLEAISSQLGEKGWFLYPGVLYLGTTLEKTETRGFRPVLDGRSSTGRLGAFMHITAGYGDNGFRGNWTLEIAVIEPLILYPGQRLLQISYETLEGEQTFYGETKNSSGTYQDHPSEPIASKSSLAG